MRHTITLLTLLFPILMYAQSNMEEYYYYVNKAELAICDSNYADASTYYEKAFQAHTPFSRDLMFAFKINHKYAYNVDKAVSYFHLLAKRDVIYMEDVEDSVKYSELWNHARNILDTTTKTVNKALSDSLNQIFKDDQSVRWADYPDEETRMRTLIKTDSLNLEKIKRLYAKYDEISHRTAHGMGTIYLVLIHYCPYPNYEPVELLGKEMVKGYCDGIHPTNPILPDSM